MSRLERWIAIENLFPGSALCKTIENHRNWNSSAGRAHFTTADVRLTLEKFLPCNHRSILAVIYSTTK
jgi:hypothetical protein